MSRCDTCPLTCCRSNYLCMSVRSRYDTCLLTCCCHSNYLYSSVMSRYDTCPLTCCCCSDYLYVVSDITVWFLYLSVACIRGFTTTLYLNLLFTYFLTCTCQWCDRVIPVVIVAEKVWYLSVYLLPIVTCTHHWCEGVIHLLLSCIYIVMREFNTIAQIMDVMLLACIIHLL